MEERGISDIETLQDSSTVRVDNEHISKRRRGSFAKIGFCVVGDEAYTITWALQYVNLFMINVGYIILAGSALKVTLFAILFRFY